MSLSRRIADHFVAPAGRGIDERLPSAIARRRQADTPPAGPPHERACAVTPPRTPVSLALLAPPGDAPALAAGLGLALARRDRAPVAVVCLWAAAPAARRAPALPAAARLAATLTARGHR